MDPAAPWCRLEDRAPSESDGTFLLLAVLKVSLKLKGQVTIKGLEETGGAEGEDSWVLADRTARRALQTNLAQCARGRRAGSHLSQRGPWPERLEESAAATDRLCSSILTASSKHMHITGEDEAAPRPERLGRSRPR